MSIGSKANCYNASCENGMQFVEFSTQDAYQMAFRRKKHCLLYVLKHKKDHCDHISTLFYIFRFELIWRVPYMTSSASAFLLSEYDNKLIGKAKVSISSLMKN